MYNTQCIDSCPVGTTVEIENTCYDCESTCKTCVNTPSQCTSCFFGDYMYNDTCVENCNDSFTITNL